jgi:hypothetical protein
MQMKSVGNQLGLRDLSVRFYFSLYIALIAFIAMALLSVALRGVITVHIGPMFLTGNGVGDSELRDRILYLPFYLFAPLAVLVANWRTPADRMPSPGNAVTLFGIIGLIHSACSP